LQWAFDTEARVTEALRASLDEAVFPGCTWAVGEGERVVAQGALGVFGRGTYAARPMTVETLFDLASLTKVTATLPAVLLLAERGEIHLDRPVSAYLPGFSGGAKDRVTLRHLLTHTGGLVSHRPFYASLQGDAVVEAAVAEPLEREPGTRVEYSDLGFILLGAVVRQVTGQPLDAFVAKEIFAPLGMDETTYRPPTSLRSRIAPTETPPDQDQPKVGVVHDENAEAMGGVSGHAGLFAPLADVVRYVTHGWLGDGLLSPWTRAAALRLQTEGLGGRRGLGWVLRFDGYDPTGDFWPATSFSHTGFTGTSIAADPVTGVWAVLLTNRVHFGRGTDIGAARRRFHNAVAGCLREVGA